MKTISVTEFKSITTSNNPPPIIDVRTRGEYEGMHIPGSHLHPLDRLDPSALAEKYRSSESPLYILCHAGSRAKKAADRLRQAGLDSCVVVEGGIEAWDRAGFPVEKSKSGVLPLPRQMQLIMGTLVVTSTLLAQFVHPAWGWLAGFIGAGLLMAGLTDYCPARDLVAAAPWNRGSESSDKPSCCGV